MKLKKIFENEIKPVKYVVHDSTLLINGLSSAGDLTGMPIDTLGYLWSAIIIKITDPMKDFSGFPDQLKYPLIISNKVKYKSFNGLPKKLNWIWFANDIDNLKDINKHIHSCRSIGISKYVKSNILGLLLINDLDSVELLTETGDFGQLEDLETIHYEYAKDTDADDFDFENEKLFNAFLIVNKWLQEPMSKQRMINCQSELIEAGFEEYAQL
jgi:hypothetical protein